MSGRNAGLDSLGSRLMSTGSPGRPSDDGPRKFDARNPLAQRSSMPPPTATAKVVSNAWLLHPWLPIDVRIPLVVGVGIAGGYVYLSSSGQLEEFEDKWKKAGLPTELPTSMADLKLPEGFPSLVSLPTMSDMKLPSALSDLPAWLSGQTKAGQPAAVQEPGFSMNSPNAVLNNSDAGSDAAPPPVTEPIITPAEAEAMTQIINEAFGAATPAKVETAVPDPKVVAARAAGVIDQTLDHTRTSLDLLRQNIGDGGSGSGGVESEDTHKRLQAVVQKFVDEDSRAQPGSAKQMDELVLHLQGVMGIKEDLSSSNLLRKAVQRGQVSRKDQTAFQAANRQAYTDTEAFERILREVEDYHHKEVAKEVVRTRTWAAKAKEYLGMAEETVELMAGLVADQDASHKVELETTLRNQELDLSVDFAESANNERVDRSQEVDKLRSTVNALQLALETRSQEVRTSATAHTLSAAVFSLTNALSSGESIATELSSLRKSKDLEKDALVTAVLASLPSRVAEGRVGTTSTLQARWIDVKRAVSVKAALPKEGAGLLSVLAASIAASLKINETPQGVTPMSAASLDTKLANVDSLVVGGHLPEAAAALEEVVRDSAAAHIADDWLSAVRARALADQAAVVLRAHAAALSCTVA